MGVGDLAPLFSLKTTAGRPVSLDDFLIESRALLLFYPTTWKGCCGDRLGSDVLIGLTEQLSGLDTVPIAIVTDGSMSPKSFMKSLDIPYPIVIDHTVDTYVAYNAVVEGSRNPHRHTVIVGRDGRIHYSEWGSPAPERLLEILRNLDDEPVSIAV